MNADPLHSRFVHGNFAIDITVAANVQWSRVGLIIATDDGRSLQLNIDQSYPARRLGQQIIDAGWEAVRKREEFVRGVDHLREVVTGEHKCRPPGIKGIRFRDAWACPECGRLWGVLRPVDDETGRGGLNAALAWSPLDHEDQLAYRVYFRWNAAPGELGRILTTGVLEEEPNDD